METTIETPFVEQNCTFTFEGREFTSGGAYVTEKFVTAYVGNSQDTKHEILNKKYDLTDWHGNKIGTIVLTTKWHSNSRYISDYIFQGYATINGKIYTGRTSGFGSVFKGKLCAKQN